MPFIPHTADDVQEMLAECGVESIEDLFDEIEGEYGRVAAAEIDPRFMHLFLLKAMRK